MLFHYKVYKIKFISLCKKNKIVYRAMKKIKARINVFTEKKKYELVQKSYDAKLQNIKSSFGETGRQVSWLSTQIKVSFACLNRLPDFKLNI